MTRPNDEHLFFKRGDAPAARRVRPILLLLIFVSAALMLLSRLDHSVLSDVRWGITSRMAPVFEAAMVPVDPIRAIGRAFPQSDLQEEVKRLREENRKLSSWEWRAHQLESKLAEVEAIAKVVPEQELDFVTSRVIADAGGTFVRNVMIDAGSAREVKCGYPVISADGLAGRVVDIGTNAARVLLITDVSSRIPVVVGPNKVRAILTGDNSERPSLLYIPDGAKVSPGDDVATSGAGGLFPTGLRIGVVVAGDSSSKPSVRPRADLDRLTYVSVLFYDNPSAHITDNLPVDKPAERTKSPEQRAGP